jgi:hypothetical protein
MLIDPRLITLVAPLLPLLPTMTIMMMRRWRMRTRR